MNARFQQYILPSLKKGAIGVLPTDTIYGIVGSALNKKAIERIYRLRKRSPKKPVIVLIGSLHDVKKFGVALSPDIKKTLSTVWPNQVSVILPVGTASARRKFSYLHRGTNAIAFRLPKPLWLRQLLTASGPLAAPSANVEGEPPAKTIKEAKGYFGDRVDFYVDAGKRVSEPSTLVGVEGGKLSVIRTGAVRVKTA
ncbi:MAG TPA: L-threonylcarbamoyladenylate synthase [Candidatus Paceibacterota bacterium]|nr:L-threonylcarbamoyladenylate synthase [Candidatus Paceibacterota bacterium]